VPLKSESRRILSLDRGSSSFKIAVYEFELGREQHVLEGGVDAIGAANVTLWTRDCRDPARPEIRKPLGDAAPTAALLAAVKDLGVRVDGVGHRIVFGGNAHELPERVTDDLLTTLEGFVAFDPLHLPDALAAIRAIEASSPELPQVVCFDTAFHRRMPPVAQRLPLPRALWSEGVQRYGYHGLSYESIVHALGEERTRGKMIVAHLGNGASLAAMENGRPIDTTMGFSPLGGLMMGTRPGELDPGVLLYLLRNKRYTFDELDDLLTHRSGLLGVSQLSADMLTLLERRERSPAAAEAVEMFVYEVRKNIGALAAVLGGLDTIVFTGGIGEHAASVRWEVGQGLAHLGVTLDSERNAQGSAVISVDGAGVVARVIPANENRMVAAHTCATLFGSS
jgi:acetate kinase